MGSLTERCSGANLGLCANSGSSALVAMMETAYFGERSDSPHLRRLLWQPQIEETVLSADRSQGSTTAARRAKRALDTGQPSATRWKFAA